MTGYAVAVEQSAVGRRRSLTRRLGPSRLEPPGPRQCNSHPNHHPIEHWQLPPLSWPNVASGRRHPESGEKDNQPLGCYATSLFRLTNHSSSLDNERIAEMPGVSIEKCETAGRPLPDECPQTRVSSPIAGVPGMAVLGSPELERPGPFGVCFGPNRIREECDLCGTRRGEAG
jgi:hypothetical protein